MCKNSFVFNKYYIASLFKRAMWNLHNSIFIIFMYTIFHLPHISIHKLSKCRKHVINSMNHKSWTTNDNNNVHVYTNVFFFCIFSSLGFMYKINKIIFILDGEVALCHIPSWIITGKERRIVRWYIIKNRHVNDIKWSELLLNIGGKIRNCTRGRALNII